ncbi:MAG: response regulator [Lachnospiraceae bacterium]|nr:response regulator [Lachnospiraceae bacterium]
MTSNNKKIITKIILMIEVVLLISSILFCAVSITRARVGIRKAIQQRMLDIANCAAGSVNGDVLGRISADNIGSDDYNDVYNRLAVFRDNVELEYVYSIKKDGDDNFIFTMDLDQLTPASYGDSVEYTDALNKAGNGIAAVDEIPYTDQWGEFYSAYSPVFDSSGNVAGIVAVDFSVEWFEDQLSSQTRSTIISYFIILLISQFVAGIIIFFTVRPFIKQQAELFAQKVSAESASNAKSDFLANMSHEIRTPINAVLGMNEMIMREDKRALELDEKESEDIREALKNIGGYSADVKKAGHNLLAIVNDILDFSKIEAGKMDIVEAPYQLSSMLNDLNNLILFKAQDKALDFAIDVDKSLPHELFGDEVRIRQVITNLLNNAVKYTEKGSVKLTFRGEKTEEGKLTLVVMVKDTGIGIKEEDIEKLFNKFQRLEMEHNSTVEGTGLGLAITQRLIKMMGGSIDVKSEYKKGSLFTVRIPQKIVSNVPIGDFQAHFEANMIESRPYRETFRAPSAKILIVDDTRINLTVAVNLLKNTKVQIETATSGAESIAMSRKVKYDLILMDQRMPEMDGTQALHHIRETEGGLNGNTPVICLTADAVIGAKERYLAQGFNDYLTKPIDVNALEKMMVKYLPEEKVEIVKEIENTSREDSVFNDDNCDMLRRNGVEPDIGMQYCQNDENFYLSVLTEYANSKEEKADFLQKNYSSENWKDYSIYVHSLKSTSKLIGAIELSDIAAKLEAAANAGEGELIRMDHDTMMRKYDRVTRALFEIVPKNDTSYDNEVIEFLPVNE